VGSSKGDGEGQVGLAVALGFTGQGMRQSCSGRGEVGQGRRVAVGSRGGLGLVIYGRGAMAGRGEHARKGDNLTSKVACSARRPERSLDAPTG
jgi:hypothetical protein